MGVPVVSLPGEKMSTRVSYSLAAALGCPDMVARDSKEYEDLVVQLARRPEALSALRNCVRRGREEGSALYSTEQWVRDVEGKLAAAVARHVAGLPPDDIDTP
mmetsp:Transcript_29768/g.76936  ORF Transcript_29768/g.76936 Transcript_29768/m.76936 type:complete len:103 (-) Transcript_29768:196-504(-)